MKKCLTVFCTLVVLTAGESRGCYHPGKRIHVVESISTNHTDGIYPTGTSIRYSCDPGYILLSNDQRICLENGSWRGKEPYCGFNVADTASIKLILSNENKTHSRNKDLDMIWNASSKCVKVDGGYSSYLWYFQLNKNYYVDLIEIGVLQTSGVSQIPEISFSTVNFTLKSHHAIDDEFTTFKNHYYMMRNGKTFIVYSYEIKRPKLSQYATLNVRNWSKNEFTLCNLKLFTSLDVSNSLCDLEGNKQLRHFYYNDKCFVAFPPNTSSNFHDARKICNGFKTNSASLMIFDPNDLSALNYMFSYIKTTIGPNNVEGENYWVNAPDKSFIFISMKGSVRFSSRPPYFKFSQICEYDLFRCGSPEQRNTTIMTYDKQHAYYSCPSNFTIIGSTVRNCLFGQWTLNPPDCICNFNSTCFNAPTRIDEFFNISSPKCISAEEFRMQSTNYGLRIANSSIWIVFIVCITLSCGLLKVKWI
ncbi:hypothetical protein CHUAL_013031 [Chamberlinius hualienensis]